ncbi:Chorismate mutase [uncultured archaeon]|nr:Chorismate mutase [uncultured archaeon]
MVDKVFSIHRKEIDKIDKKIMKLIETRLYHARKLGEYKKKNGIPIIDKKREKEIIRDRVSKSKLSKEFTSKLFLLMINESRRVQK